GRGSRVVRGRDVDLARRVKRGLQVVGRKLGVEVVQRRDLTGAETEGDRSRRAAAGGSDRQRLAGQAVTDCRQAKLGERRAGERQTGAAGGDADRAGGDRRGAARRGVDGGEQVRHGVANTDAGAGAGGARREGEGGAVDDQRVGRGEAGGEV